MSMTYHHLEQFKLKGKKKEIRKNLTIKEKKIRNLQLLSFKAIKLINVCFYVPGRTIK